MTYVETSLTKEEHHLNIICIKFLCLVHLSVILTSIDYDEQYHLIISIHTLATSNLNMKSSLDCCFEYLLDCRFCTNDIDSTRNKFALYHTSACNLYWNGDYCYKLQQNFAGK